MVQIRSILMRTARLVRQAKRSDGNFGVLTLEGNRFYTVERPDLNNQPNISCIPAGTYKVSMTFSPRFKRPMYLLQDVPKRAGIRIHPANLASQLNGCIALGLKPGSIDGKRAVLLSAPAVRQFEQILGNGPFELEIIDL